MLSLRLARIGAFRLAVDLAARQELRRGWFNVSRVASSGAGEQPSSRAVDSAGRPQRISYREIARAS